MTIVAARRVAVPSVPRDPVDLAARVAQLERRVARVEALHAERARLTRSDHLKLSSMLYLFAWFSSARVGLDRKPSHKFLERLNL